MSMATKNNVTDLISIHSIGKDKLSWSGFATFYLCGLGILGNCLVAIVLSNRRRIKPDVNYQLMFVKSLGNILYFVLLASAVYPFVEFEFFSSWFLTAYILAVAYFFLDFLSMFRLITHIVLSIRINALLSIPTSHSTSTVNNMRMPAYCYYNLPARYLVLAIVVFSLGFYIQKPFGFVVAYSNVGDGFMIARSKWGNTDAYESIVFVETLLEDFLTVVVLTAFTIRLIIVFRDKFRANANSNGQMGFSNPIGGFGTDEINSPVVMTSPNSNSSEQTESLKVLKSQALMVIVTNCVRISCYVVPTIVHIMNVINRKTSSSRSDEKNFDLKTLGDLNQISLVLIVLSPTLAIFVYFFVNKNFRLALKDFFRKYCCCCGFRRQQTEEIPQI